MPVSYIVNGVFMTQPRHSTDGFVPRRPGSQLGAHHRGGASRSFGSDGLSRPTQHVNVAPQPAIRRSELGIARTDISDSLKGIDDLEVPKSGKKGKKNKKPQSRKRRIIKWSLIVLGVIALAIIGWIVY